MRRLSMLFAATVVAAAVAACGGSDPGYNSSVPWSGGDQGTFIGACQGGGGGGSYCECALEGIAAVDTDTSQLGESVFDAGMEAGQDHSQFTACQNGGG